jgi:hypothetical protein
MSEQTADHTAPDTSRPAAKDPDEWVPETSR